MTIQYLGLGTAAVCPDTTHVGRKGMKSCQSNEQIIYLEPVGLKIEQHDSNLFGRCQHMSNTGVCSSIQGCEITGRGYYRH